MLQKEPESFLPLKRAFLSYFFLLNKISDDFARCIQIQGISQSFWSNRNRLVLARSFVCKLVLSLRLSWERFSGHLELATFWWMQRLIPFLLALFSRAQRGRCHWIFFFKERNGSGIFLPYIYTNFLPLPEHQVSIKEKAVSSLTYW